MKCAYNRQNDIIISHKLIMSMLKFLSIHVLASLYSCKWLWNYSIFESLCFVSMIWRGLLSWQPVMFAVFNVECLLFQTKHDIFASLYTIKWFLQCFLDRVGYINMSIAIWLLFVWDSCKYSPSIISDQNSCVLLLFYASYIVLCACKSTFYK